MNVGVQPKGQLGRLILQNDMCHSEAWLLNKNIWKKNTDAC